MFCIEEHKWGYFMRIYIGTLGTRPHLGGRILTWGDASPPGEDALPAGEDALPAGEDTFLTRAYVRVHNIYLETFFVPCFIFITQCIDNQYFQEMKHWHSMFHF